MSRSGQRAGVDLVVDRGVEPKPAGDGGAIAAGRQNLVFDFLAHEQHQAAGARLDGCLRLASIAGVDYELATIAGLPVPVEIRHHGDDAIGRAPKAVEMSKVEAARRVVGEMALEFEQPEKGFVLSVSRSASIWSRNRDW